MASNGEIKIEKGVPAPSLAHGNQKFPFPLLEVGDSFFVGTSNRTARAERIRLYDAARAWSQRHEGKMLVRRVDGGVRVWRVE